MKIKDIKEINTYDDIEVYEYVGNGIPHFHTDSIRSTEDYSDDTEVKLWELMNEEDYDQSILANATEPANFGEWYDDKEAKVLCIII